MTVNQIEQKIKKAIINLYGEENIKAAFITGSLAAGKARSDSDVDIVVCYSDTIVSPKTKKRKFVSFYFDLHKELSRTPDDISPGEILSFTELSNAVRKIEHIKPSAVLTERTDFDAICWAGMLVSKRIVLIPNTKDIEELVSVARAVVNKWAEFLEPKLTLTEGTGEFTDGDKVLRRGISCPGYYDAH